MSDQSTAELEREAEMQRARVADTAETIRSKMTPGQLIDEFTGMFAGGDTSRALANLRAQIRDNPLPLTLVGTGLAWLMLGHGAAAEERPSRHNGDARAGEPWDRTMATGVAGPDGDGGDGSMLGKISSGMSSAAGMAGSAAGSAADMAGSAAEMAGSGYDAAAGAIGSARDNLARAGASASSTIGSMGARAQRSAQDMFDREPLSLAAIGLAVGTVIGALLPSTEIEDEQLGPYRDKLGDKAQDMLNQGIEGAKEVAAESYEAAKGEADRQGLTSGEGESMAERLGEVVTKAVDTAESATRDKLDTRGLDTH
jgi:hypothetical protein